MEVLRNRLFSEDFLRRHRASARDFTRTRKLPFVRVVLFLLNLVRSSLQNELDRFFQVLEGASLPVRRVTKSAFSQARAKLRPEAFAELNRDAADVFYAQAPVRRWNGFRLVAFDGTTARLPKEDALIERFGEAGSGPEPGCAVARVSTAFDPLNDLILDTRIGPYEGHELSLALEHLDRCHPGDLILMDRGYPATWFLSLLASRGLEFCCRVPEGRYRVTEAFRRSGRREAVIALPPSVKSPERYAAYGLPFQPLRARILRVTAPRGGDLFLITSLRDRRRYPREVFGDLYHQRWGIEESYKRLKRRLELEQFSGLTPLAIEQDAQAKAFAATLTAILSLPARDAIEAAPADGADRHPRRMNWTQAFGRMKHSIVLLFLSDAVQSILDRLTDLFRSLYDIYRPGRHFPRSQGPKPLCHVAYKPIT